MKSLHQQNNPWYQQPWFIILSLVLLPPLGLILMWKFAPWSSQTKGIITVAGTLWFLVAMISGLQNQAVEDTKPTPRPAATTEPPQTSPLAKTNPTPNQGPAYREVGITNLTPIRQERHYVLRSGPRLERSQVLAFVREVAKTCPKDKICDLMLWDSEESYKSRNSSNNQSDVYAANNAAHLAGYRNSGNLFYYYGTGEEHIGE